MINRKNINENGESHTKVITEIHGALERNQLEKVMSIVKEIGSRPALEEISQSFLLTYHYNFKTRFFEKADFNYCLQFSDLLNKRTPSL